MAAAVLAATSLTGGASAQTADAARLVGASPQAPSETVLAGPSVPPDDAGRLEPALDPLPATQMRSWAMVEAAPPASAPLPRLRGETSDHRPAAGAVAPGFRDLFTSLDDGLSHLATRRSAIVLAVGAGLALAAHVEDRDVTALFSGSAVARRTALPGTVIGNGATQFALAFGTYAIGRAAGSTRAASLGADLVRAQILTQAVTYGLKTATRRTRPDGTAQAFPSGHASATFATAAVLQRHLGWKAGVPAFAVAGYVAASRLASNRHYPSDVVFGAVLGTLVGQSVTLGSGRARFAIEPVASPGGAGIAFTRVVSRAR